MTAHYNLDRMQYAPGPPPAFIEAETPQGADWWSANRDTPEAAAILKLLADASRQLAEMNAKHMEQA